MPWLAGDGLSWQVHELARRSTAGQSRLPAEARLIRIPLRAEAWQTMLADHPDRQLVEWMTRGIRQGFRVGYQGDPGELRQARQNFSSVRLHPEVVRGYLDRKQRQAEWWQWAVQNRQRPWGYIAAPSGSSQKRARLEGGD